MLYYILRRIGLFLITAFILSLIAYALQSWVNGSAPVNYPLGYFNYILKIFNGNWGVSIIDHQPILSKGLTALAGTLELCFLGIIFAMIFSVPLGTIAGLYRNTKIDYVIMTIAITALSLPVFWLAVIMSSIPNTLNISLPIDGQISPIYDVANNTGFMLIDSLLVSDIYQLDAFYSRLEHLILPAIVLSFFIVAETIRLTRSSISMVMKSNYIKAAYSKGLSTFQIVRIHILKNIYPTIVHELRSQLSALISFAMTIDIVFSLNGTGQWLLTSIQEGDYVVLPTAVLLVGGGILLTGILIDIFLMLTSPAKRKYLYVD